MSALSEFRDYLTKSDLITIAAAFVFGAAFTLVINSLVTNVLDPLIGIPGHANLSDLGIVTVNGSTFMFGAFLSAVINFILIALALFFVIVRPYLKYKAHLEAKQAKTTRDCPDCLSSVPIKATRCAFCTSPLPPPAPG